MPSERTQYASSILVSKSPVDAAEIVRVRLSQAKLLNDEFADFFKKYYSIKAQYLNDLNKLVQNSEDLNNNIEFKIIENQVLTKEELKYYNVDAIGHLSEIWNKVIGEIKDEIAANNQLKNTVSHEVVGPLTSYTSKNKQWSDVRELHSKISDIAQAIEYNQEKLEKHEDTKNPEKLEKYQTSLATANSAWDSEAPYVFEVFEHTDFSRLNFLRDSLLRFITAYTDSLNKISQSNEKTLETILNFNPDKEIARFAKVSAESQYIPKEARKAAESPKAAKKKHSFIHLSHNGGTPQIPSPNENANSRNFSVATAATTTTAATANTITTAATGRAEKKSKTKLRSRVGSIFGKKKDKKKLNLNEPLPESDGASSFNVQQPTKTRESRTSSFVSGFDSRSHRGGSQTNLPPTSGSVPKPVSKDVPPLQTNGSYNGSFNSIPPLQPTIKGQTQKPSPLENSSEHRTSEASYSDGSSHINVSQENVESASVDNRFAPPQTTSVESYQQSSQSQQHRAPPPPPASRKSHFPQGLGNIREDGDYQASERSFEQPQIQQRASTGQNPNRRDIQSGLFSNLNVTNLEHQNKRLSSYSSFNSESIRQLNPQSTGSSLIGQSGLFQHPTLNQPGLNASIAEVVNARFKDGEQIQSQIIGEIAFSYQGNEEELPTRTNLKVETKAPFDKVIPNSQVMKQVDANEFEISPQPILSRTLGGLKYLIKSAPVPVIVLPAWRFEPHQASVMLNIKLAPYISSTLSEGQVITLKDFVVSVAINGASTSALSKPLGSFNKDKSRITWRFKEPVQLSLQKEEKLVARFITETQASESEQGVSVKFTIDSEDGTNVTNAIGLESQNFTEDDPFAQESWKPVPSHFTVVAGNYGGIWIEQRVYIDNFGKFACF